MTSGWLCVLKEVLGVQLSMGVWCGKWWVWLERCRDDRYTHCTVMCGKYVPALQCALLLVSLVLGEEFFGGSASLHD